MKSAARASTWTCHVLVTALVAFSPLRADPLDEDASAPTAVPITDPAAVAQQYHQVAARPEFHDAVDSSINPRLEDLLSDWFKQLGAKMGEFKYTSRMPAFESLLMSLLVAFSLAIVIYVIYRLTRGQSWTWSEPHLSLPGEKRLRAPEFYDEEIAQAIKARDWHEAWLAAWRQFLSRLERRRLVEADRTRTNREYLGQLRAQPLPASALALLVAMVDAYDRFIYGRAAIGEAEWNDFHHQLEEAALLLHLDDKRAPATTGGITA
jgi:hypothetical protein